MAETANSKRLSDDGKQCLQILATLSAGSLAITPGITFSWSAPFLPKITKDKENYDITEEEVVRFQAVSFISVVIFCPIFSKLCDVIGRKRTLLLMSIPDLLAWILIANAERAHAFYLAKVLSGISNGIMLAVVPTYIGEISEPEVRGTWGNSVTVFFYAGQLFVTVVGSYYSVQTSCYIFMPIPVVFGFLFTFMPDSPVFFLMKGRHEEAGNSLRRLRGRNDISTDLEALKADVDRQMSERGTWRDLFLIKSNRKALIALTFLRFSQILSGSVMFVIYIGYIFEKSVGTFTSETSSIIYMALHLLLSLSASFIVNLLGRKKSLVYSLTPCSIILFIESVYFYMDEQVTNVDFSYWNWIPVIGLVLFVVISSFGIDIMPTLMQAELFSAAIKAKGIGLLLVLTAIMAVIINYLFYLLSSSFGMFLPILIFACCNAISAIIASYIIPETRGRTLEEIQQDMKGPVRLMIDDGKVYEKCNLNIL
ncbi:unnamed protein product [Phaedon cochleariae]|uniref:Major facilitator superfamily (MFS) profile domain-containing protein n=1 Tax=Phaedon cochleariae TaxID=80249 RepID=A0A9P0DQ27_PHACE|nr:unnamed protein product [Phaedon cochleariae]